MDHDAGETLLESEFYDALNCLVMRVDGQSSIQFANRFALNLLGYDRLDQVSGRSLKTLLPTNESDSAELLATVLSTPSLPLNRKTFECDLLPRDGTRVPVSWTISRKDDGTPPGPMVYLVGFDARSIRESQATAEMFQTVSDNFAASIIITDPQQTILYVNPALVQMTGYAQEEVVGKTPNLFKSGQTANDIYRNLWETVDSGGIWRGEFINRRKDGEHYLESKTITAIRDQRGRIQYYLAVGEDNSQRQLYQQRIESLLAVDQLTHLPNRNAFLDELVSTVSMARQEGKEASVLFIDVDDFFSINEAIGASHADSVIVEIASRIKRALRQDDRLARIGNDKFALILGPHEVGGDDDIREVTERVQNAFRSPIEHAGKAFFITLSIGYAAFPQDGGDASELLSHAMTATECAKKRGGNTLFRFDSSMVQNDNGRPNLLQDLRGAIERNEFVLYFQPQVSLVSGSIVGLEALIRWRHPQHGLVMPSEFIPRAEEGRLIVELDDWVLREACRQMGVWRDAGLPPIKVAINLSARHFLIPGLPTAIASTLADYGIEPGLLEIEITEGAMMHDVAAAIRSIALLKEIGVRIALDDFGTGYSSLAYLHRFPINVVKIDQSFVRETALSPANAAIVQAIIAMSHKLGKTVLAEGVETEEQMQYLRRNQCDEMQGFFFSKPLPSDDVAEMLRLDRTMSIYGQSGTESSRDTVLFVDDEANILASLKRTLRREGYLILTAGDATEALTLLARNTVQVVVSDQRMPGMNGTEFLSRVKSLYPETVRMVLSGYSEISAVTDSINKGAVYRFLMKPWEDETLKAEIVGALRHWRELYGESGTTKDETRMSRGAPSD